MSRWRSEVLFLKLNVLRPIFCLRVALCGVIFASKLAMAESFKIKALDTGQEVTLATPATTRVPHGERFYISATDLPQTVSFKQVWTGSSNKDATMKLSVYDKNMKQVQYLNLKLNIPQLYTLKSTEKVLIITEKINGKSKLEKMKNQFLEVQSSKPLTFAR